VHLAGRIVPADMPAYFRAADAIVHPSMSEGLPNAVVEAAACGRAVLGSAAGGTAEVIVHGETGWVLACGDVAAWSEALVRCARDPVGLRAAGAAARARAEAHFDARRYPFELLACYERSLEVRAGAYAAGKRATPVST
jgi:glycosyltransferase involved in cell wall biosynthesis